MLKKRALSLLLALAMIFSVMPTAILASGETDAVVIEESVITTSTSTVTVRVTGFDELSGEKLKLATGPIGTETDYDMKGRTTLKVLTFTGPGTYQFEIDSSKLTAGNNIQAFIFSYDVDKDVTAYWYSHAVEITDGEVSTTPSVSIDTETVTNRTTELSVTLKNLPESGIFRVVQLDAGESYDSAKLNSYTSLYFAVVSSLKNGENTLTLSAAPTAGSKLLAVIRDSGEENADYTSDPVAVTAEEEPSILSIVGGVDTSSTQVTVNFTRVPEMGVLKIIALDAGEAISFDEVFSADYGSALYTGYFYSAGLKVGENVLKLTASPASGKVLYAVARDSSGSDIVNFASEGVTVTQASTPIVMFIKGELTNNSTTLTIVPKKKPGAAVTSTLSSAALYRSGSSDALAEVTSPTLGEAMTFTGLSGLTAGEKLTLVVTYDGGKTAQWEYLVCDAAEENSFEIVEKTLTPSSTTVTVKVSGYNWYNNREDWSRICLTVGSASQTTPGDDEGREDLTSQVYTGKGTYTFTIPADKMSELEEGKSIMAALRFYDGNGIEGIDDREYYAAADSVVLSKANKTPLERLANCSVAILENGALRTSDFKQEKASVEYSVTLDDEIPSATLGFYAYPGTVSFDPDGNHKFSLGSTKVTGSGTGTVDIDLTEVPVGYRVIASLYVCIDGDDWYRHVNSAQTPEVVDENGKGFEPYVYPNASIDETELKAGDTSLHMSLTGDDRFFQYAKEGKITIYLAIGQYPADESFDFEGLNQVSMLRAQSVTEAFSGREFTFEDEPLRAGYRVRAVVYWTENADLFIAKGNDYEAVFKLPDDSVLISGTVETAPTVKVKNTVKAGDTSAAFTVGGTVPEGSVLLVKSYDAGTTQFETTGGIFHGVINPVSAGDVSLSIQNADKLTAGRILVAFLTKDGDIKAQSQPVTVGAAALFTVTPKSTLTVESTTLDFTLESSDSTKEISAVYLCRVNEKGIIDYDKPVATLRKAPLGDNTFTIPTDNLTAGEKLRILVYYWADEKDDYIYFEAGELTVAADQKTDSFVIENASFTTESTSATVTLTGYDSFKEYYLNLTTGSASSNDDADSRDRLGSQIYNGSGTYTFTFDSSKLTGGNTIQAYLYRYDSDADRTYYAYSNAVAIEKGETTPTVSITTENITTDATSVSVAAEFDGSALLTLYSYSGDSFSPADHVNDHCGITYLSSAPSGSQNVKLTKTLAEGDKLIAVLWSSLGETVLAQSQPVTVAKAPEKEKPSVYLLTQKVTAGMTHVNATMRFDKSVSSASYTLYQFDGDTLDTQTATKLASGTLYTSQTNYSIRIGIGLLKAGSNLQLVLNAGGEEARSVVIKVDPSPDWGTPYAAFSVSAVKSDAKSVSLAVDYSDEYLTMGDDFYCDVTVYACSGEYTDDEIEDRELWENYNLCRAVAKANSRQGNVTKGDLTLDFYDSAALKAGEKLFIKLRLPHVEWEDEEVDYLSASIPVVASDEEIPEYLVVLYNFDSDTSRGASLRAILKELNIPVMEMTYENLNQSVGYLAGLDGYEPADSAYTGKDYTSEFMLICNLPETLLDRFLDAMQADGLRIDHKAIVTAYNRDTLYYELMDEIANEHDVFQMLLKLNSMIEDSKKLSEADYGSSEHWDALQKAIAEGEALIRSEEPSYEDLSAAYEKLKAEYLAVTEKKDITGTAVITITPEEGGTYSMTASVQGGDENGQYEYLWSNGSTEQTVTGISADRLIGMTVTVTEAQSYGKLTAQLAVPDYSAPDVSTSKNTVTVKLKPAEAGVNTPAATQYVVSLYQGDKLVESKTVTDAQDVVFRDLTAKTTYTVKSYAVSPVGRSDILTQTATTTAGTSGRSSSRDYEYYTIHSTAGENGSISPTGSVRTREGNDRTFTITPNAGYVILDVKVDGKSVGAVSSYTFKDIRAGHTIEAVFAAAGHVNPQTGAAL